MSGNAIVKYSGLAQESEQKQVVTQQPGYKPIIVGIYGLSGCGKSYLLKELEKELGKDSFAFYEGSVFQAFDYLVFPMTWQRRKSRDNVSFTMSQYMARTLFGISHSICRRFIAFRSRGSGLRYRCREIFLLISSTKFWGITPCLSGHGIFYC